MLNTETKSALLQLARILNQSPFTWVVTGSTNLAVQGLDLQPADIDIATTSGHLHDLAALLGKYQTQGPVQHRPDTNQSYWTYNFDINGKTVELLADESLYQQALSDGQLIALRVEDDLIPCFVLEVEVELYKSLGRQNKVELIRQHLSQG